jgi:Spx/MgsR family transcriptional regulator
MIVYGLKTCDTCRKARKALDEKGVAYAFRDVRETPPTRKEIRSWAAAVGWERLLNTSSTTWRALPDAAKADIGEAQTIALMQEHPTLIKRPIIRRGPTEAHVGWSDATRKAVL